VKVLLVGGTGNISTSIVEELRRLDHDVSGVVRGVHRDEVPPDVRRIHADRRDYAAFEQLMSDHTWDAVIDMVAFNADDARSAIRAFRGRTAHYVVCSTVVVYGREFTTLPTTENEPHKATDAYGGGKVELERVLREEAGDLPVTVLRPSHNYGRVVPVRQVTGFDPAFVDRLRRGRPILVTDAAEKTTWTSLHVDDAALAFVHCLGREACIGKAYHVVGTETFSWADYHRRVAAVLGVDVELVPQPLEQIVEAGGSATAILGITAYDGWFTTDATERDIPEFQQRILLEEGTVRSIEYAEKHGLLTSAAERTWEDDLIESVLR
jgi:nucleoside-diphosphate-sugar epimerase